MEEELHIILYGEIGGDPMFGEVAPTSDEIQNQLLNSKSENVVVHISSPGGGVFQGWTIGNIIKNSGKNTTALIEGYCGSIATFVALSCDRVEMAEAARFMIHNPTFDPGSVEEKDLEAAAQQLATIKDDLINIYRKKTGLSISQLSDMMGKETSMTQEEAQKFGFVDGKMTPLKAVAKFDIKNNKMLQKKEDPKITESKVSKMDQILEQGKHILKKLLKNEAHNIMVTLADGSTIFIDSEDGEFEGKRAWTVDEAGNPTEIPVEDGTFVLEDGRSITVEGGIVQSVQETEPAEVDLLKEQLAKLEQEIKSSQEEKKVSEKDAEQTKKSVTDLLVEVKNLKKMTVGDKTSLKKPHLEPQNKFRNNDPPETGHPLDAFAAGLKRNRNKTI